ncbi:MAG: amidohydrolase family protein [Desulfobacterales bacterium]|nr:amidohydrolase family protein [Desulfobacterales bacterium]
MSSPQKSKDLLTICAGWVIDGSGDAVQENVRLRIQNGLIAAIGASAQSCEERSAVLDLSGDTILPCLVDSHVHLFMSGTSDLNIRARQMDAPFSDTKKVIARHIAAHLMSGVTAVRDGGDHHAHALRYRDDCLDKDATPFQLQAAGRAWHRQGRYGRLIGRAPADDRSLAEAIAAEDATIDHVKIVNSGLNSLVKFGYQTPPQFSLGEMKAAVGAARRKGLFVMAHANGKIPVEISVSAGCHSIEHGFFMGNENLKQMAEKDIFWIPTAATMKAYCEHLERIGENQDVARRNLEDQMEQIAAARNLRVPIAVGTDAGSIGVQHGSGIVQELIILKQAGLSIQEAIQCATANGARLLNLPAPSLLCRGLPASFIVVTGGPDGLPDSLLSIKKICIKGVFYDSAAVPSGTY